MTQLASVVVVQRNTQPTLLGTWQVPDDEHTLMLLFDTWPERAAADLFSEISLDGGVTWLELDRSNGCVSSDDPKRPHAGATLNPLPQACAECGEHFLPGDGRFARALSHSTITLKQSRSVAELNTRTRRAVASVQEYKRSIILDRNDVDIDDLYVDRVFHTPTPVTVPRLVRATITSTGPMSTTFTVTTRP